MLNPNDFFGLLAGLGEVLPHAKTLSQTGLNFAWLTFPAAAKGELTAQLLAYACNQRAMDPAPNDRMAIHIQLLQYLYPLRDGAPFLEGGLRRNLDRRLLNPNVFHPLVQADCHVVHEVSALDQAPPAPPETPESRRARIHLIAKQTGVQLIKQ